MKIGVFGGTFNPIHNSHIYLAEKYADRLSLDLLLIIPTYIPPHKRVDDLAEAADRLAMCELAVERHPAFEVSDYEVSEGGLSYTCKTLRHFAEVYQGADFFLLMGADMFLSIQDWKEPREIFRLATVCAAAREKGELEAMKKHEELLEAMGARCVIMKVQPKPLSSTEIRGIIHAGGSAGDMLPDGVWEFIKSRGLYGAKA